jgi:hypothetical protein
MTITPVQIVRDTDATATGSTQGAWFSGLPVASMLVGLALLLAAGTIVLRVWLIKRHERRDPLDVAFRGVSRKIGLTAREAEAVRALAGRAGEPGAQPLAPVVLLLSSDALARATSLANSGGPEGRLDPGLLTLATSVRRKAAGAHAE